MRMRPAGWRVAQTSGFLESFCSMTSYDQVAIVGVGLLGGSLGLALRQRGIARRVIGIGRDQKKLDTAAERGIVDRGMTNLAEGVKSADLVVVCTPVEMVAEQVAEVLRHAPSSCLVTDVGSSKQSIVDALYQAAGQFVGSHPLAGDHRTGAENARADLFDQRTVVVTPTNATPTSVTRQIADFWRSVGAEVVELSPSEHDAAVAVTSHLPHMVATALANTTPRHLQPLTASGWADTTRVAAGDAALWRQIFLSNRELVLAAVASFEQQIAELRDALVDENGDRLEQLLAEGKRIRDAVGN